MENQTQRISSKQKITPPISVVCHYDEINISMTAQNNQNNYQQKVYNLDQTESSSQANTD